MNHQIGAGSGPQLSRRTFLGAAAGAAGAAFAPGASVAELVREVEALKKDGWEPHPCACNMCGGYCGLLAMHKKGTKPSPETVRIMPNPTHPQRGCCARGASAMWVWNHPMRLRKPMKRVGERGSGEFKEISWDEAFDEIAARVKDIVSHYGERAVTMTSHNFSGFQQWFGAALGTPNIVSHSSTCNSASVAGRRAVFGKGFDGAGKVEPDYARCRYLLLIGRTLNCAMGVASVFAKAKENSARVVFVDPRMPEGALSAAEWVPIRPGTDSAFLQALIAVGVRENLVDRAFLAKHSNAPYLIEKNTRRPVYAKACGLAENGYVVMDEASGGFAAMGLHCDEKGAVKGFNEPAGIKPVLDFEGEIEVNGTRMAVETAFAAFMREANAWTPERAAAETGIPAETIVRIAREFFTLEGVCDDGWYSARNGNDTPAYQLMSLINVFAGNIDREGGFVVTQGGGYSAPGVKAGKGPDGQKWAAPKEKALDKKYYPEGSGTFSALFNAMTKSDPYPIRAAFVTGTTMFHREANSARLEEAMKALDLLVVQDIFPHEIIDYADFVLPTTFFLEWHEYAGLKWCLDGCVQKNDAGLVPPEGCDAREEIWQFCEILRRAYPERAAERLGYDHEMKTREEFRAWLDAKHDKAWAKFIAKKNAEKAGEGDRIARDVEKNGWALAAKKKFGQYPTKKCFGTPTGKPELVSFLCAEKYETKGWKAVPTHEAELAYTEPKPRSNEFVLVSGKDSASCSGVTLFTWPTKFLGDRTLWINPVDAERLGIRTGDTIEVEGLDNGVKGTTKVTVTNRVMPGVLFSHGFSGGVRTKKLHPAYAWTREGVNSHWFATGYREPVTGSLANNSSVRIKRI